MTEFPSEDVINGTIDDILSRPEFQRDGNRIYEYILEKLIDLLEMLFDSASGASAAPIIVLTAVALIAVLTVVFFVLRARRARRLNKNGGISQTEGLRGSDELLRAAESFAERGDFDKAVILLFLAHLKLLEAHHFIKIEKSKTNIQYELELKQNGYDRARQFKEFKDLFNIVRYGYRHADKEDFDVWRTYCLVSPASEDAA